MIEKMFCYDKQTHFETEQSSMTENLARFLKLHRSEYEKIINLKNKVDVFYVEISTKHRKSPHVNCKSYADVFSTNASIMHSIGWRVIFLNDQEVSLFLCASAVFQNKTINEELRKFMKENEEKIVIPVFQGDNPSETIYGAYSNFIDWTILFPPIANHEGVHRIIMDNDYTKSLIKESKLSMNMEDIFNFFSTNFKAGMDNVSLKITHIEITENGTHVELKDEKFKLFKKYEETKETDVVDNNQDVAKTEIPELNIGDVVCYDIVDSESKTTVMGTIINILQASKAYVIEHSGNRKSIVPFRSKTTTNLRKYDPKEKPEDDVRFVFINPKTNDKLYLQDDDQNSQKGKSEVYITYERVSKFIDIFYDLGFSFSSIFPGKKK